MGEGAGMAGRIQMAIGDVTFLRFERKERKVT